MRQVVFIAIFFFSIGSSYSQNTFEFTIRDTITDQLINDALELSNGSFILVGQEVYPTDHMKAHLYRITASGKCINE